MLSGVYKLEKNLQHLFGLSERYSLPSCVEFTPGERARIGLEVLSVDMKVDFIFGLYAYIIIQCIDFSLG